MATSQDLPYLLDSKSECPPLFNGTTRLYYSPVSPFSQSVLIAVNYKGLDEIECVPISLKDKPTWYMEKVYPLGKVPALEHNGKVKGESLDLLVYLDQEFGGPTITPTEEDKKEVAVELLKYMSTFIEAYTKALGLHEATQGVLDHEILAPGLDHLENALGKYANEGPFMLGKFSMVDIAYIPFIERAEITLASANYNNMAGRPNLTKWTEAMNTIDAYTSTKLESIGAIHIWEAIVLWLQRSFKRSSVINPNVSK